MNFVLALELELKLEDHQSEPLAGALLLFVEDVVRERASYTLAQLLREAVPELAEWGHSAPTLAIIDPAALEAPTAGGDLGELQGLLSRFGVDPGLAPVAASVTLRFLSSRLPTEQAQAVVAAMPVLIGQTGA